MHDNLTNSRGASRIQTEYDNQQFQASAGVGMQSPPNMSTQQMMRQGYQKAQEMNYQSAQQQNDKHFMQDAIERKIEKFSSQNINVQKRVNTSSKFRNNTVMMTPPQAPQSAGVNQ